MTWKDTKEHKIYKIFMYHENSEDYYIMSPYSDGKGYKEYWLTHHKDSRWIFHKSESVDYMFEDSTVVEEASIEECEKLIESVKIGALYTAPPNIHVTKLINELNDITNTIDEYIKQHPPMVEI